MIDLELSSDGYFRLGDWLVQPRLNRISRGDSTVTLEPKMMQVLVCLAEHAGDLVVRQILMDTVWATEFISENILTRAIAELRSALGDDAKDPTYIETIHRCGYRLIPPVERLSGEGGEPDIKVPAAKPRWPHILAAGIAAVVTSWVPRTHFHVCHHHGCHGCCYGHCHGHCHGCHMGATWVPRAHFHICHPGCPIARVPRITL